MLLVKDGRFLYEAEVLPGSDQGGRFFGGEDGDIGMNLQQGVFVAMVGLEAKCVSTGCLK